MFIMGIGMVLFCSDLWLYPKVGGSIFNLYLDVLTLSIQLVASHKMISTIKNSVVNYFILCYRWFSNPSGHTWPPPRSFVAQTVTIVEPSFHLVHILWITPSSACLQALSKTGAEHMQNSIHLVYILLTYSASDAMHPHVIWILVNSFNVQKCIQSYSARAVDFKNCGMNMALLATSK